MKEILYNLISLIHKKVSLDIIFRKSYHNDHLIHTMMFILNNIYNKIVIKVAEEYWEGY